MDARGYLVQELNDTVTLIAASLINSNYQWIDTISCVGVMDWVSQDFWLVGGVTQNNTRPSPKSAFKSQQPSRCSVANESTFLLNLFRLPKWRVTNVATVLGFIGVLWGWREHRHCSSAVVFIEQCVLPQAHLGIEPIYHFCDFVQNRFGSGIQVQEMECGFTSWEAVL